MNLHVFALNTNINSKISDLLKLSWKKDAIEKRHGKYFLIWSQQHDQVSNKNNKSYVRIVLNFKHTIKAEKKSQR